MFPRSSPHCCHYPQPHQGMAGLIYPTEWSIRGVNHGRPTPLHAHGFVFRPRELLCPRWLPRLRCPQQLCGLLRGRVLGGRLRRRLLMR
eukprot:7701152-Pyramimonas_sp.AAC.1